MYGGKALTKNDPLVSTIGLGFAFAAVKGLGRSKYLNRFAFCSRVLAKKGVFEHVMYHEYTESDLYYDHTWVVMPPCVPEFTLCSFVLNLSHLRNLVLLEFCYPHVQGNKTQECAQMFQPSSTKELIHIPTEIRGPTFPTFLTYENLNTLK